MSNTPQTPRLRYDERQFARFYWSKYLMPYWKPLLALLLVAGFGAACAPTVTPTATRIPPTATSTVAPARATEIVATAESFVAVTPSLDPEILALRPEAPATGDDFRPDSYRLVASTGRPQLIEFFSYT